MKKLVCIVFIAFMFSGAAAAECKPAESVIYEYRVVGDRILGRAWVHGGDAGGIEPAVLDSGACLERLDNSSFKIEQNLSTGKEVILPLLKMPCGVDRIFMGVDAYNYKFLWRMDAGYTSLENDDVLVRDGLSMEEVASLGEAYMDDAGTETLPGYRLYLSRVRGGENTVRAWVGRAYEYYLPQALIGLSLCVVIYIAYGLVSKKAGG